MVLNYNKHTQSGEVWKNYDPLNTILKFKLPVVLNNIPEDVETIIDIGCGNGIITNELSKKYQTLGVDLSEEALKYVNGSKLCCSADNISVADNSYDMVFSSEMLEHLPDEVLERTINEIKRISRKYVFITVPNNELLEVHYTKCSKCSFIFNDNGHLHSFDHSSLQTLLGEDFKIIRNESFGLRDYYGYNKSLLKIRHRYANRYYNPKKYTVCPQCDNTVFPYVKGNLISKVCNGLNRIVRKKKYNWLMAVYVKNE